MRAKILQALGLIGLTGLQSGCITLVNAASPTALEAQLLGEYEALDRELVSIASVRGPQGPKTAFESLQYLAISARAMQRFNEDDLRELEDAGCLVERSDAMLEAKSCAFVDREGESAKKRQARVVREENASREHILRWAASSLARKEGRAQPTEKEKTEIRSAYSRLMKDAALSRRSSEGGDGTR